MRFSIQGLLLLMLLLALATGMLMNTRLALESSDLDARLRSELDTAQLDMLKLSENERQLRMDRNEAAPKWLGQQHAKLAEHLAEAFEQAVASTILTPKAGQLSVVEVPVLGQDQLQCRWHTLVPEGVPIWLLVEFADPVADTAVTKTRLPVGKSIIDVRMTKPTFPENADESWLVDYGKLQVRVNDKMVMQQACQSPDANEFDINFRHKTQQDFDIDDNLPKLVERKSTDGTAFRIQIEKGESP